MNTKLTKLVLAIGATMMAAGALAADNATATATATVLAPVAVSKSADLSFGNFAATGSAGSVTIKTDGSRVGSSVFLSAVNTVALSAAKFDVTGSGASTYTIDYTGSDSALASTGTPADTMAYTMCSALTAAASCSGTVISGTLTAGAQSIYVGGVLTVGAAQAAHTDYTGTIKVTVAYN
jgi:Domain of unknown function (DUF4402)